MADLKGAEAAPPLPPPFGRRTDAVTVLLILWRVLNFDHSAVNMHFGILTSGFLTTQECNKFVYCRDSAPDPAEGAYSASPDP